MTILLGGSCVVGYGLAHVRATREVEFYEGKAFILTTRNDPKDEAVEIAHFLAQERDDPVGALGWLLFGAMAGHPSSFSELIFHRERLLFQSAEKVPAEVFVNLDRLTGDDYSRARLHAVIHYCEKADGPKLGLTSLGWHLYGCIKGDEASYEVVNRWNTTKSRDPR